MTDCTIAALSSLLSLKKISAEETVTEYLKIIRQKNVGTNAYITVTEESALSLARDIDCRRARGEALSPLAGIPYALKDNLCTEGVRTTCASKMLEDFIPPYTATPVKHLELSGAVLLGKTNMDEFGMGNATDTSFFGKTFNPLDLTRTPGGSSGGSAAAVSGGMATFALGSDTGGSVRLPASFCGCVGLKPTYGAISRYGLIAYASSLDTVGVLAKSVGDCETVFGAIRGKDKRDATSHSPVEYAEKSKLTVGICRTTTELADIGTARCVYSAADALISAGINVIEITLPSPELALAAYYVISSSEACSNLGRFDGIRYGHRAEAGDIDSLFINSRTEGFGDEVKRRIMMGTFCLHGAGRHDYYAAATAARKSVCKDLGDILERCDAIILPTAPDVAYKFEDKKPTPLATYRDDIFCILANLAGLPSLCLPFGKSKGLPVGVQLMGRADEEATLFKLGKMLEVSDNDR